MFFLFDLYNFYQISRICFIKTWQPCQELDQTTTRYHDSKVSWDTCTCIQVSSDQNNKLINGKICIYPHSVFLIMHNFPEYFPCWMGAVFGRKGNLKRKKYMFPGKEKKWPKIYFWHKSWWKKYLTEVKDYCSKYNFFLALNPL